MRVPEVGYMALHQIAEMKAKPKCKCCTGAVSTAQAALVTMREMMIEEGEAHHSLVSENPVLETDTPPASAHINPPRVSLGG